MIACVNFDVSKVLHGELAGMVKFNAYHDQSPVTACHMQWLVLHHSTCPKPLTSMRITEPVIVHLFPDKCSMDEYLACELLCRRQRQWQRSGVSSRYTL